MDHLQVNSCSLFKSKTSGGEDLDPGELLETAMKIHTPKQLPFGLPSDTHRRNPIDETKILGSSQLVFM